MFVFGSMSYAQIKTHIFEIVNHFYECLIVKVYINAVYLFIYEMNYILNLYFDIYISKQNLLSWACRSLKCNGNLIIML